jgi:hypothetical protein
MQYAKLRGKIREVYGTNNIFAKEIGMHPSVLSSKLNGKYDWTRREIVNICAALDIPLEKAYAYFFNSKVGISKQ